MAVQRYLIFAIHIINIFNFFPCFYGFEDGSLHSSLELELGYDFEAYPSLLNSNQDIIQLETGAYGPQLELERQISAASIKIVNVDDFGAQGDGTDDTKAFKKAWIDVCSFPTKAYLIVPKNKTYLLKPIKFSGPCQANIIIEIFGTIKASGDRSDYNRDGKRWLLFSRVKNLLIEGGGIINGNGKIWWQNSCKRNKSLPCKKAPTALTFYNSNNLKVKNLRVQDAQQIHVSFEKCANVQASGLVVTAPERSPNTDGIHVSRTQHIQISNCVIGTGDDCISIVNGSQNVEASTITCGPGHGISIGSLGSRNSVAHVSDVKVNGAKFIRTTNGVRIKTWQGGSGSTSNIKFHDFEMIGVTNPIIIDQNYCDQDEPCIEQTAAVQIVNVAYQNITGTSASHVAVKFDCSKTFPCQGIELQDINLVREGDEAKAVCNNVVMKEIGTISPHCS